MILHTPRPCMFLVQRGADETGVSGVGDVLEGIIFQDGAVSIHWLTPLWSVTFFPDWETFMKVHILPHPTNDTEIVFFDRAGYWYTWKQKDNR